MLALFGLLSARPGRRKGTSNQGRRRERMRGIEPPYSAWEADVLPLNYIREGGLRLAPGAVLDLCV